MGLETGMRKSGGGDPAECNVKSSGFSLRAHPNRAVGNFSVSLAVLDLKTSMAFYQKLGFTSVMGDMGGWAIMQNGSVTIGLFQGMFDKNILTFNPGWDSNATKLPAFTDVRELHTQLTSQGIEMAVSNVAESPAGPAHFVFSDPDGNQIMFDQHV